MVLSDSMPMDSRTVMKALIYSDMNYNLIAPTSLYPWPWIGIVDKFGLVEWLTIGMNFAGADSEPVLANNTFGSPFLVVGTRLADKQTPFASLFTCLLYNQTTNQA